MPRIAACLAACLLPLGAASAQSALGPLDNTLLKNSLADSSQFGAGLASGDVDGDGNVDLVVATNGGFGVRILRGAPWTVGGPPAIKFFASTFDPGRDFRANAMVTGDFDGDGRDEIAFGAPSYSGVVPSGGRAFIGRRDNGGSWSIVTTIQQGSDGYPGAHEQGDSFGNAIAVGDFDDDGYDDIAVGARGEAVGTVAEAGAVMIQYGSASGITSARGVLLTRDNDGLTFAPGEDENYGAALASGDFDADGYADLAIGASGARCPDGTTRAGGVIVLYGSAGGLATNRSRIFRPGTVGMLGECVGGTLFGFTLAAGGYDTGITSDLAIGTLSNAVHVVYSQGTGGLATTGNQRFTPADVPGVAANSRFGTKLASGTLRRRSSGLQFGIQSLAVSADGDTVNGLSQGGSVVLLHATAAGLTATGAERWTRSASRTIGAGAVEDRYGSALAVGDYNDDGMADLAIGVPYYDDGAETDDGAVEVLYGSEFIFRDGFE